MPTGADERTVRMVMIRVAKRAKGHADESTSPSFVG